jgi:mannose-1-phosphate guanylyltransferase
MMHINGMKAVVLAAGVGSRLDPLTTQLPKPMIPVVNRPLLEHLLMWLNRHGITEVYSNLHYLPDSILNYFVDGYKTTSIPTFQLEEELSGDAGGVRLFRRQIGDQTFLVIMGDLVTDADLDHLVGEHKKAGAVATIGLKKADDVSQFGVVVQDSKGFITGFQEKPAPEQALSHLISTAIYIFEPAVFEHMPAAGAFGFGRHLFPALVNKGLPILGVEIKGYWSDAGTIKQYQASNFDALKGKVDIALPGQQVSFGSFQGWVDISSRVSDRCTVGGSLMVGKNSTIGDSVEIHGHVIIGDNCTVESGAYLEDTIIWSNTQIQSGAHLVSSIVGYGCTITPETRLRQDVLVEHGSTISCCRALP